jgi:hypothetical protein
MGELKFCRAIGCYNSLPPRHSRYCRTHSPFASSFWKRQFRARLRAESISPHLDYFKTITNTEHEARLAYNDYRRAQRRRQRENSSRS